MKLKYIMFDVNGLDTPVIFPGTIQHDLMRSKFEAWSVLSAGFVSFGADNLTINAYGESNSLKVKSRKEDSDLIKMMSNLL